MTKRKLLICVVVIFAIFGRLWLTDKAWHVDMWSNAGWGEWIYDHGPAKFYDNSYWTYAWPTQPPVINSIYAFNKRLHIELLGRLAWTDFQLNKILPGDKTPWLTDFVYWFGYGRVNLEIPFQIGFLVTMKLIPVAADLAIAWLVWLITKKTYLAVVFLLSPFSWYVSALWGQYDGVGFALVLGGVYLLYKHKLIMLSPGLILLGILIKPTALILAPFVGYYYLRQTPAKLVVKVLGVVLAGVLFWTTTAPYTHKNPFEFAWYDLKRIVFEKAEPRVTTNAFNLWRIVTGNKPTNHWNKFLGIPAVVWGLLAYGAIHVLAIWRIETNRKDRWRMWEGLFVISAGSFMFMTGMLDRYLYAGMLFGLILVATQFRLLKWWLVWSVIFWLNLYNQWWIPASFEPLKQFMLVYDSIVTRILSGFSVIILVKLLNFKNGSIKTLKKNN